MLKANAGQFWVLILRLVNFITLWTLWWPKVSASLYPNDPTLPTSRPHTYAPSRIDCPENLKVFLPSEYQLSISLAEQEYISSNTNKSLELRNNHLSLTNLTGFNITAFVQSAVSNGALAGESLPNLGFALSGGGNRALLYASSILDAFDSRNSRAHNSGTGGLLQLANYATGLSSSSWLLGGWANTDFAPISPLVQTSWTSAFKHGYLSWSRLKHLPQHYRDLRKKKKAGFPVSIVEDDFDKGRTVTFSSVRQKTAYINRTFPFPIMVSTSRKGEGQELDLQSPIYEFTPEDFNVWHKALNASIPIQYLGSQTSSATQEAVSCAMGFDNIGFLMDGKDLKKSFWIDLVNLFVDGKVYEALVPNPFKGQGTGITPGTGFVDSETETLLLADGAMAQETLPLFPLLHPSRKVDVIIAADSTVNGHSFDNPFVSGYPNGTALHQTYTKLKTTDYLGYKFPEIPEISTPGGFVDSGYHKKPTFFGCGKDVPLIIYIPNYFVTHPTDQPTMQAVYKEEVIAGFFDNGFYVATQSHPSQNGTDWPVCLACAVIDGQNRRNRIPRTTQCTDCFKKYCAGEFIP